MRERETAARSKCPKNKCQYIRHNFSFTKKKNSLVLMSVDLETVIFSFRVFHLKTELVENKFN